MRTVKLILLTLILAAASFAATPYDFDGDGKADIAVFRPSSGTWYVLGSKDGFYAVQFGAAGDIPIAADYNGDGKTQPAVFRPMTNGSAQWFILGTGGGFTGFTFGYATDIPVPADYDGDGRADPVVFRNGSWLFAGSHPNVQFGLAGDIPAEKK